MTLEEEFAIFYHELGAAISQWARVEYAIYLVISSCVMPEQRIGLGKALFSIENSRSRLDFADSLMDTRWAGDERISLWVDLLKKIRAEAQKRNNLAHQVALSMPTRPEGERVTLQPWTYKPTKFRNRTPQPPPGSLGIRQIAEIRAGFTALAYSLENLAASLAGQKEPHPKRLEQSNGLPTMEAITRQIRAALLTPPQPSAE